MKLMTVVAIVKPSVIGVLFLSIKMLTKLRKQTVVKIDNHLAVYL
jgi:hypothetical protein